ncbi:hypothetical protein VTN00DRAFT_677 [Thermoascus crustaceus]|uniref:uncharacterized protein n=1 Tax=Thermoascus crustaceus TaxID=5088 RepID=UPI003742D770
MLSSCVHKLMQLAIGAKCYAVVQMSLPRGREECRQGESIAKNIVRPRVCTARRIIKKNNSVLGALLSLLCITRNTAVIH